jgi:hypothetical protein
LEDEGVRVRGCSRQNIFDPAPAFDIEDEDMKNKISRRKSIQSSKQTGSKVFTVASIVVVIGIVWGVGYIFGHEILKYSKLTSILIAPIFCLLLIVVFWVANNF